MQRALKALCIGVLLAVAFAESGFAQRALTWQEVRDKFRVATSKLIVLSAPAGRY